MNYDQAVNVLMKEAGVQQSTMMKTPCLRYKGDFIGMMFDKEESLIIKVSPDRVNELIKKGEGNEFNFTKKRFKEWVLIPLEFQDKYEMYLHEALEYAKNKK